MGHSPWGLGKFYRLWELGLMVPGLPRIEVYKIDDYQRYQRLHSYQDFRLVWTNHPYNI
jgi:hypothetical protein